MTTVVEVLNRAARHCSIVAPSSWVGATKADHVELRDDFLLETIDDIRDRIDLPAPIGKQTTIAGTGAESYSLPTNYHRLQKDALAIYETTTLRRAGSPISADGLWSHINQIGGAGAFRYYKIEGYDGNHTIKFEDDLTSSDSVTVSYVSTVWCASSGGAEQSTFQDDTDVILLPRRLVENGIVAKFRDRRGLPSDKRSMQFEVQMARWSNELRNSRTVNYGPDGDEFKVMRVPVPDYIPAS